MNEPLETPTTTATDSELKRLRNELEGLHQVTRLALIGVIIATSGLCLFMYRQTKLMRYQIIAQRDAVVRAEDQMAPAMAALAIFKRVGDRHPDYASNVLARFRLPPLPRTNSSTVPPQTAPAPVKK